MKRRLETYIWKISYSEEIRRQTTVKCAKQILSRRQFPRFFRIHLHQGRKERKEERKYKRLSNKGFILGFVKPATDKKWCKGGSSQTLSSPVSGLDRYLTLFDSFLLSLFALVLLSGFRERQLDLCENNYMAFGDGNPSLCFSLS